MFGLWQEFQHPVGSEQNVSPLSRGHISTQDVIRDVLVAYEELKIIWVSRSHSSSLPVGPARKMLRVRQGRAGRSLSQCSLHNRRRGNKQLLLGVILHLMHSCQLSHLQFIRFILILTMIMQICSLSKLL